MIPLSLRQESCGGEVGVAVRVAHRSLEPYWDIDNTPSTRVLDRCLESLGRIGELVSSVESVTHPPRSLDPDLDVEH